MKQSPLRLLKQVESLSHSHRAELLIDFVSKKPVLQSLYDMMFLQRIDHRGSATGLDSDENDAQPCKEVMIGDTKEV